MTPGALYSGRLGDHTAKRITDRNVEAHCGAKRVKDTAPPPRGGLPCPRCAKAMRGLERRTRRP